MKALQIVKPREFSIVELDKPKPQADEIVVKLEYAALCNQNDYKIFYGLYGDLIKYPCDPGVYGHEGVGIVVETGSKVKNLQVGDRVVMMIEGGPMLYMEYVLRKADSVAPIDKKVSAEEAAVLELFGCAHHCLDVTGDVKGKKVALTGLGPAGMAILQLMLLAGPKEIVGVEISAQRVTAAQAMGLKKIINPSVEAELKAMIEEGADVVIDATGVPRSIINSFEISNKEVVIFGFTNEPFLVDQSKWFAKEMVIKNSKAQTIDNLRVVAKLLEKGKIDTKGFVSGIMSFEQYDQAVEKLYKQEAIKILMHW